MGDVEIRIGLPLPMDVVTTLTRALSVLYPNGAFDQAKSAGGELVAVIPEEDRLSRDATKKALRASKSPTDDPESEGQLHELDEAGTVGLELPEVAKAQLAEICVAMLSTSDAPNYMEIPVRTADGTQYAVAACRGMKQTPHALRMEAEQALAEARAKLAAVESRIMIFPKGWPASAMAKEIRAILSAE
jgi:hypothetical protein